MNKRMWVMLVGSIMLAVLYFTGYLNNQWIMLVGGGMIVAVMAGTLENEMRYKTSQLIGPNIRGSVDLETMIKTKRYCAVPIGSVKSESWNIYTKGGQGTVVFRKHKEANMLYKVGEGNAVLMSYVTPTDEQDLDPDIHDMIIGRRGFKPPFYVAEVPLGANPTNFPPEMKSTKVDMADLTSEMKSLRRRVNTTQAALRGQNAHVDREISRITGAARKLGLSRWRQWFGSQEGERVAPAE